MPYVKGKGYVRKGYTEAQDIVAEWINLGHLLIRTDPVLRCYAINGEGKSRWYVFVKTQGRDLGGGAVELQGSGVPGKSFVTSDGKVIKGKVIDQTFTSGTCGLKIHVKGWGVTGRQVLAGILKGS